MSAPGVGLACIGIAVASGIVTKLAGAEGIDVETVLGADDVASAPRGEEVRRRRIAGIFFLYKVPAPVL